MFTFTKNRVKRLLSDTREVILIAVLALLILVNLMRIRSPVIGTAASVAYIATAGYYMGKILLLEEKERLVRWLFGIFLVLCLFIFIGTPVVVLYQLDVAGLAGVLFAAPALLLLKMLLWPSPEDAAGGKQKDGGPWFSFIYVVYFGLIAYCAFLLLRARSGWVYGTVWSVVSPSFFVVYFLAAIVLTGIILYSNTRSASKILLTILFSLVSASIFALVLHPGNAGDPMDHLGFARLIYGYGELKRGYPLTPFHVYWLLKEKGLALLSATLAKMFSVDVYWIHTFNIPVMWSLFMPLVTFKISRFLGWKDRVGILAAFLTSFYVGFVGWSSRSTGNSLGFVPFFVSMCFSLWYVKRERKMLLLLAIFTALISALTHPLTGTMAFIFMILTLGLKNYGNLKLSHPRFAYFLLLFALVSGFLIILALFSLNNLIYRVLAPQFAGEASTAFSLETLLSTNAWTLVFGEYIDYSFEDLVLSFFVPFFGLVGLAYALKKSDGHSSKRLVWPLLGAFVFCIVMYRILKYAMVDVLFGPGRLWTFRDLIGIPFVAFVFVSVVEYLEGGRFRNPLKSIVFFEKWSIRILKRFVLTWLLIGLALSALAVASIKRDYEWLGGLQPTELEVEAVRYIDQNTEGRYVVFTMPTTTQVGWGFVGTWNFMSYYLFSSEKGKLPTVADMTELMRSYQAGVGYFIASFRTPNLESVLEEASRMYGLFKVLSNENGEIYIFHYKIPPLPANHPNPNADVMAFHWSAPPGFFVQNGLLRVILGNSSLDVRDFWGDLYEGIDFDETLVNGKPIGNWTSIDRYDPSLETWVGWEPGDSIASSSEFRFRVNFDDDSLVGIVDRGSTYVRLWWESALKSTVALQTGDFERLYLPGLVGGINSSDVNSREFGLLYTVSHTSNVVVRPVLKSEEAEGSSLAFGDIENYGNLSITTGYLAYELYVHNVDVIDHWANIEVWLPDLVYQGSWPPFMYSVDDGKTWSQHLAYIDFPRGGPAKTYNMAEVNWFFSKPSSRIGKPEIWRAFAEATGGPPVIMESFSYSGGGQNRMLFGLYLPAGDHVLLRIGFSVYYSRPLKMTYFFEDSDHVSYGLQNLEDNSMKFYNVGSSSYVGGWNATERPTSLRITEDETGKIESTVITFPANTSFSLHATSGVDTTIDANGDGIPDRI